MSSPHLICSIPDAPQNTVTLNPAGFETAKALFVLKHAHRPSRAFMTLVNYELLKSQGWALGVSSDVIGVQQIRRGDLVFEFPDNYPLDEFELEHNGSVECYKVRDGR